ncbi:MAG TPA: MMPL family transporter, partial [Methylomirabilota bacterium]
TRFRSRFARLARASHPSPHRQAALETLRQTGPPMFITTASVAIGFSALLFSEFLGLANLGLLTGLALLGAFLADVFLAPLLLMRLRPRIRVSGVPGPEPAQL